MRQSDPLGMLLVLRNNWPFYVAALGLASIGLGAAFSLGLQGPLKAISLAAAAGAIYWAVASLAASWWIYDLSGLYRMNWLQPHLPLGPCRALNLHAGLDLTSKPLQRLRPQDFLVCADIYDPASMTEGSIRRARRIGDTPLSNGDSPPLMRLQSDQMPLGDASFDVVYMLLAAHEVRSRTDRRRLFREVQRVLKPDGRAVLLEHFRDGWNWIAFGPGSLHFLSRRQWSDAIGRSGLRSRLEARRTPFLHFWILQKPVSCR